MDEQHLRNIVPKRRNKSIKLVRIFSGRTVIVLHNLVCEKADVIY